MEVATLAPTMEAIRNYIVELRDSYVVEETFKVASRGKSVKRSWTCSK